MLHRLASLGEAHAYRTIFVKSEDKGGGANILRHLLIRRFGPLTERTRSRMDRADIS